MRPSSPRRSPARGATAAFSPAGSAFLLLHPYPFVFPPRAGAIRLRARTTREPDARPGTRLCTDCQTSVIGGWRSVAQPPRPAPTAVRQMPPCGAASLSQHHDTAASEQNAIRSKLPPSRCQLRKTPRASIRFSRDRLRPSRQRIDENARSTDRRTVPATALIPIPFMGERPGGIASEIGRPNFKAGLALGQGVHKHVILADFCGAASYDLFGGRRASRVAGIGDF